MTSLQREVDIRSAVMCIVYVYIICVIYYVNANFLVVFFD